MNNPEVVEVGRAGHDPRELKVVNNRKVGACEEIASRFTNRKRFTSGLDLVYCITSPFSTQSETMRKNQGSVEMETPSKGKMLG